VLSGVVKAATVATMDGQAAKTVNGASVAISVQGGKVTVGGATVTATDVMASNGVIHVIDSVILPPAPPAPAAAEKAAAAAAADKASAAAAATAAAEKAAATAAATAAADKAAAEKASAFVRADIVDTAVAAGSFTTLAAALSAAGLVDTLKGQGPFTVFAPTDAAFAKLPAGTVEDLLKPENKAQLTAILTYHVLSGVVKAATVATMDGQAAKTVNGASAAISVQGGKVTVGGATVTATDVMASNGVIHVIDSVILPPTPPAPAAAEDAAATAAAEKAAATAAAAPVPAAAAPAAAATPKARTLEDDLPQLQLENELTSFVAAEGVAKSEQKGRLQAVQDRLAKTMELKAKVETLFAEELIGIVAKLDAEAAAEQLRGEDIQGLTGKFEAVLAQKAEAVKVREAQHRTYKCEEGFSYIKCSRAGGVVCLKSVLFSLVRGASHSATSCCWRAWSRRWTWSGSPASSARCSPPSTTRPRFAPSSESSSRRCSSASAS
jgi:uncharacterized surface protein with fasciclin (FAS1) repeats